MQLKRFLREDGGLKMLEKLYLSNFIWLNRVEIHKTSMSQNNS